MRSTFANKKEGRWKISFDSPQDPIDLASLRRDLALSALLADASQALTGFTNLDGASVGQTTGSGSSATEHCPQCGGDLKIIAAIEEPAVIVKILTHLGLPARAPPRLPARPLPLFQAA